jgi:hypothetical protein
MSIEIEALSKGDSSFVTPLKVIILYRDLAEYFLDCSSGGGPRILI